MLRRNAIKQLLEGPLRVQIMVPVLRQMGFSDVTDFHGTTELGKDIVMWSEDPAGARTNYAVVLKAKPLSNSRARREALEQINQAFQNPFPGRHDRSPQNVDVCWVVVNKQTRDLTRQNFLTSLGPTYSDKVRIYDLTDICGWVEKYLPIKLDEVLDQFRTQIGVEGNQFSIDIRLGDTTRPYASLSYGDKTIILGEQYEGQLDAEPFVVKATFAFPDSPEGQVHYDALQRHFSTGVPVEIPGEYVTVELPDSLLELSKAVFDTESGDVARLSIWSSPRDFSVPVRIELKPDDGPPVAIDAIELRPIQAGADEITLTNEHQQFPIGIKLVIDWSTGSLNIALKQATNEISAPMLLRLNEAIDCLSRPGEVVLLRSDHDLLIARSSHDGDSGVAVDDVRLAFLRDIAKVQHVVGRPIIFPDRPLTAAELEALHIFRQLLTEREFDLTWTEFSVNGPLPDVNAFRDFVEASHGRHLVFERQETMLLSGVQLPFGTVKYKPEHVKVAAIEPIEGQAGDDGEPLYALVLEPGESRSVRVIYDDWPKN